MSDSEGALGEENREVDYEGERDDGGFFHIISIHMSNSLIDIWGKLTDMIRACEKAVEESSGSKKRALSPPERRVRESNDAEEGIKANVKVSSSKRKSTSGKRT